MAKHSAGLLVYRRRALADVGTASVILEVLAVHPGGPYWSRRDDGWWSIPKGEVEEDEDDLAAAEREFSEELGLDVPPGPRTPLGEIVQSGGKRVRAWAVAGDLDVTELRGGTFELEWPPRSGGRRRFPEVDRAMWCTLDEARIKLLAAQLPFLERLERAVGGRRDAPGSADG